MVKSSLTTSSRTTKKYSSREKTNVDMFLVHHGATTSFDGLVATLLGQRQVSANYAIGSGEIVSIVPEEFRAWTSGSSSDGGKGAAFDRRAITVEVKNLSTKGWTVSEEDFKNLARLIADVSTRYGFPINDDTVLTHQELWTRFKASYPTACPGDLQRRKAELLKLAKEIQSGEPSKPSPKPKPKPTPKPKPKPSSGGRMARPADILSLKWTGIQRMLKATGRYSGKIDNIAGSGSIKGLQRFLNEFGYSKAVFGRNIAQDGIEGPETVKAAQQWLKSKWGYTGSIDGLPGDLFDTAWNRAEKANNEAFKSTK